jgi:transcription-repair coupling factor (superfamily II helicase)
MKWEVLVIASKAIFACEMTREAFNAASVSRPLATAALFANTAVFTETENQVAYIVEVSPEWRQARCHCLVL